MTYSIIMTFKDMPNVHHFMKFVHAGAGVVELKFPVNHPRSGKQVMVYFRGPSARGKNIYYYSEGSRAGEALGG